MVRRTEVGKQKSILGLVDLIAKNNNFDILKKSGEVEDDMECFEYDQSGEGDEEEEEEEEEEDEESDPEIDEDDPLLYNCPFCLGLFENKVDMNNHVDGCMPV